MRIIILSIVSKERVQGSLLERRKKNQSEPVYEISLLRHSQTSTACGRIPHL
jgi:hypothetical protein